MGNDLSKFKELQGVSNMLHLDLKRLDLIRKGVFYALFFLVSSAAHLKAIIAASGFHYFG